MTISQLAFLFLVPTSSLFQLPIKLSDFGFGNSFWDPPCVRNYVGVALFRGKIETQLEIKFFIFN